MMDASSAASEKASKKSPDSVKVSENKEESA
jgi:hypothetical protein